jgi:uncharacterized protein (TIGR03067 family)
MTRICVLLAAACIFAALCGCDGNATRTAPPTDDEMIKGTWEVTSATINGESFPSEGQEDIHIGGRYVFDGETLTKTPNPQFPGVTQGGSLHRYHIDATKTPKQIEIQLQRDGSRGPWPPEKTIYKLDNDSLVLCWSIVGEAAPKEFESKEGENIGLYEFRRVGD